MELHVRVLAMARPGRDRIVPTTGCPRGGDFGSASYSATNLGTLDPTNNNTALSLDITSTVSGWIGGGANTGLVMVPVGSNNSSVTWGVNTVSGKEPQIVLVYKTNGCNQTVTIQATGVTDTFIDQDKPTNWFGDKNPLETQPSPAGKLKQALIRFDLSAIPAGVTINSGTLNVVAKNKRTNHVDQVHRMITAWTEGTNAATGATWNDPNGTATAGTWAAGAAGFSASDYDPTNLGSITPNTQGIKSVSITNLVNQWVNGSVTNNGVALISTGTDTGQAQYFSSRRS